MKKTLDHIHRILKHEADAIKSIPVSDAYWEAIQIIHQQVHERGGKLVASGMGKAGQIAISIATTFSSTGTPAIFLHPSDAQHGDLGVLQKQDILFLVSNSGKTREVMELLELSRNIYPSLPVILLTGNPNSPLAESVEVILSTGHPKEVCPLGLTPTTSTTVMAAIGDALVVLMMEKIGFSADDYAKRHHGGYLGQKSRVSK